MGAEPDHKKPRQRTAQGVVVLAVAALLVGGTTVFVLALPYLQALPYNSALNRWQSQGITHYEMEVTDDRGIEVCQWRIEAQDGEIVNENDLATNSYACASAPTVDDLFAMIAEYSDRGCGPGGCACDGPWTVTAHYDPQYGFPAYVRPLPDTNARFLYLESWVPQVCILAEPLPHEITVGGFTPLP